MQRDRRMLKLSLQMVNMNGHNEPPLTTGRHPLASQPWPLLRFTQGSVEAVPSACKSTRPPSCGHSHHPSGLGSQVIPQPLSHQGPHAPPLTAGQALPCAHPSTSALGLLKVQTRWEVPGRRTEGGPQTFAEIKSPGSFLLPLAAFAGVTSPSSLLKASTHRPCWIPEPWNTPCSQLVPAGDPGTHPGKHQWATPRMLPIHPSPP